MIKRVQLGKVCGTYNGLKLRHLNIKTGGGRISIFRGKRRVIDEDFGTPKEALLYCKENIDFLINKPLK